MEQTSLAAHQVLGSDAAGDVVRVGRLVKSLHIGQKVVGLIFPDFVNHPLKQTTINEALGFSVNGVFGDYVLLREGGLAPVPCYLSYVEAATLPSSGLTAWNALGITDDWLQPGDTVLLEGTGGVATLALQFAVALGARAIVTSGSDEKLEKVKSLGAAWGINYKTSRNWSEEVLRITDGHGANVVVDTGGVATLEESLKSVAYEGSVAILGDLGGGTGTISASVLMSKAAIARGIFGGSRSDFLAMCEFMESHHVHPEIDRTYSFADFERAFAYLKSEHRSVGKIVLVL